MFDLEAIKTAKDEKITTTESLEVKFNKIYQEGLNYLRDFTETKEEGDLKNAASGFFAAIRVNQNRIEPYLYLAYIFYLFDDHKLAGEYLDFAKIIDPKCERINDLKKLL